MVGPTTFDNINKSRMAWEPNTPTLGPQPDVTNKTSVEDIMSKYLASQQQSNSPAKNGSTNSFYSNPAGNDSSSSVTSTTSPFSSNRNSTVSMGGGDKDVPPSPPSTVSPVPDGRGDSSARSSGAFGSSWSPVADRFGSPTSPGFTGNSLSPRNSMSSPISERFGFSKNSSASPQTSASSGSVRNSNPVGGNASALNSNTSLARSATFGSSTSFGSLRNNSNNKRNSTQTNARPQSPSPATFDSSKVNQPNQAARFSVNSNLMNYSIPKVEKPLRYDDTGNIRPPTPSRSTPLTPVTISRGDSSTRMKQFEAQIESLTLQNVRLQRMNRLMKIEADNHIKEQTMALNEQVEQMRMFNVRLQRQVRLMQQELQEVQEERLREKEIQLGMTGQFGPEYEFLIQMVNLLHRQINEQTICDETCCYTDQPVTTSMVLTPPKLAEGEEPNPDQLVPKPHHLCRPIIHTPITIGPPGSFKSGLTVEMERRLEEKEEMLTKMEDLKEELLKALEEKDRDYQWLKRELREKDELVTRLEGDFVEIETVVEMLKEQAKASSTSSQIPASHRPTGGIETLSAEVANKRKSLSEAKRASLGGEGRIGRSGSIGSNNSRSQSRDGNLEVPKDTRKNSEHSQNNDNPKRKNVSFEDLKDEEISTDGEDNFVDAESARDIDIPEHKSTNANNDSTNGVTAVPAPTPAPQQSRRGRFPVLSFISSKTLPGTFPGSSMSALPDLSAFALAHRDDPANFLALVSVFMGLAALLGVGADWTAPLVVACWVGAFFWSGRGEGMVFTFKK